MDLGLRGKVAIVTGGSRGIGRACAIELAREGADVCIVALTEERLRTALEDVRAVGASNEPRSMYVVADLTTAEGCAAAVEACVRDLGGVDILVNCAGAAQGQPILELSTELLDDALRLKTYGYLRMAQLVIPHMRAKRWGRIVNIAGGAGASPAPGNLPTSLANAGVLNMTRALSDVCSTDGILVNVICPGITDTDRARDLYRATAARRGVDIESLIAEAGSRLPAGRIAQPDEIARVVTFLASEACSYVHGSSVYMDGGSRRATP